MKKLSISIVAFTTLIALGGCSTTDGNGTLRGPGGTIAYSVQIESSEPGARVEANGDYVGKTPMTLKIFGDRDGTFHNFGSYDYIIQVYPVRAGQYVQTRSFRTGGWWTPEDKIPKKLFFDLDLKTERFSIDLPAPKTNP
jgi:hypothetical protein